MERTVWTDDMLDKQIQAFEKRTDSIVAEMRAMREELRGEIGAVRTDLGSQIGAARSDLGGQIAGVRADLSAFQRQVTFIVAGFVIALIGLLGVAVA